MSKATARIFISRTRDRSSFPEATTTAEEAAMADHVLRPWFPNSQNVSHRRSSVSPSPSVSHSPHPQQRRHWSSWEDFLARRPEHSRRSALCDGERAELHFTGDTRCAKPIQPQRFHLSSPLHRICFVRKRRAFGHLRKLATCRAPTARYIMTLEVAPDRHVHFP